MIEIVLPKDKDPSLAAAEKLYAAAQPGFAAPYTNVLEYISAALEFIIADGTKISPAAAQFCINQGRELYQEFIKRNINFFEIKRQESVNLDVSLWFTSNHIEEIEGFLRDPNKLLPEWCSPRRPNIAELVEGVEREIRYAGLDLERLHANFKDHLRDSQKKNLHHNDPLERIKNCLGAARNHCGWKDAGLDQFNWPRHIRSILVTCQYEEGYEFKPRGILSRLESEMEQAEKILFKIKDTFYAHEEKIESAKNQPKLGRWLERFQKPKSNLDIELRQQVTADLRQMHEIFTAAMRKTQKLSCKVISPPEYPGYWNPNMRDSWFQERDNPRRQAHSLYERPPFNTDGIYLTGGAKASAKPGRVARGFGRE